MTFKNKKRCLHYDFGAIFVKSNTCSDFAKVFTHFAHISTDFARIFTKSKVLGVHLHPRLLHQWLAMQGKWTYTKKKMSNITAIFACCVFLVRKLYTE